MIVGVPKETLPGEKRVALIPARVDELKKLNIDVLVETGAGEASGYPDSEFTAKGAKVVSRNEVFSNANIITQVNTIGANPNEGASDLDLMKDGQLIIGMMEPLTAKDEVQKLAGKKVTSFAMELIPRITRAQSMDVLSSQANIAGYKAVIIASENLPRVFPMMTTAGGTMAAAKVFIVGVGVAGLQAIATAKRLGAIVYAYDVRPAVREQVESLGAKFVEMDLDTGTAEDKGGYAKDLGDDFYKKQQEFMKKVVGESDVVITTAAIPGKKAPILVTEEMVKGMKPGSVIVDLAAERGGNCDLTKEGESVIKHGVTIIGPKNVPSTVPFHSSQMYSKNIVNFLGSFFNKEKEFNVDLEDEVIKESIVTKDGAVANDRVKEALGL